MFWKFWKRKRHNIEGLIKAIGRFPNLTEVTEKGDRSEQERKPDPLLGLIYKAQTLDELKEIQTKYAGSLGIVHGWAIICQEFEIRLKNLEKRMSELEKKKVTK